MNFDKIFRIKLEWSRLWFLINWLRAILPDLYTRAWQWACKSATPPVLPRMGIRLLQPKIWCMWVVCHNQALYFWQRLILKRHWIRILSLFKVRKFGELMPCCTQMPTFLSWPRLGPNTPNQIQAPKKSITLGVYDEDQLALRSWIRVWNVISRTYNTMTCPWQENI